jgi:hypothetical protein
MPVLFSAKIDSNEARIVFQRRQLFLAILLPKELKPLIEDVRKLADVLTLKEGDVHLICVPGLVVPVVYVNQDVHTWNRWGKNAICGIEAKLSRVSRCRCEPFIQVSFVLGEVTKVDRGVSKRGAE